MKHETAAEALAAWDRGEIVWSLEMGGLGPGYEQALQICAMEIVRGLLDHQRRGLPLDEIKDTLHPTVAGAILRAGNGLSGAQVNAAAWLAQKFVQIGPRALLDDPRAADRKIMIDRNWPKAPDVPVSLETVG